MVSRRGILKGTAAFCAGVPTGGVLFPAPGAAQVATTGAGMDLAGFVSLSRHLTGFDDLNEDLAAHYAAFLADDDPPGWRALSERVQALGLPGDTVSTQAVIDGLQASETAWAPARRITKLWYAGWTDPAPEVAPAVRAEAYRQALAWRALGVPPRGVPTGRLWQDPAQ